MIKEFCAENFTNIPAAITAGATRIELCDNLAVGGTTPSHGVIQSSVKYTHQHGAKIMTIIRPRGGDFEYTSEELQIMRDDLLEVKKAGADGVVFGCLNAHDWLDKSAMTSLIELAGSLDITFHMAFDQIEPSRQLEAIDWLAEHGVSRILTHGGKPGTEIEANYVRLKEFISYAGDRLIILPGGGINYSNLEKSVSELEINEAHGTKIVKF